MRSGFLCPPSHFPPSTVMLMTAIKILHTYFSLVIHWLSHRAGKVILRFNEIYFFSSSQFMSIHAENGPGEHFVTFKNLHPHLWAKRDCSPGRSCNPEASSCLQSWWNSLWERGSFSESMLNGFRIKSVKLHFLSRNIRPENIITK